MVNGNYLKSMVKLIRNSRYSYLWLLMAWFVENITVLCTSRSFLGYGYKYFASTNILLLRSLDLLDSN